MKISRKTFLFRSFKLTIGSFLFLPFLKFGNTKASTVLRAGNNPDPTQWKNDEINISWIGHSTVLMNIFGTIIVTDPVLFEKIGVDFFGFTIGQSRYSEPALAINKFPCPDFILLSHAH